MIEVEKKIQFTPEQIERLIDGAEFLGEKEIADAYYDNSSYSLSSNDMWLRCRDGNFELKLPMHQGESKLIDQYEEIENEDLIREIFAIPKLKSFVEDLSDLGHTPFCEFVTTRKKYRKGKFIIDLDFVQYSDFDYNIGEIELMVENKNEINSAIVEIEKFAGEHGLLIGPVRGKVIEYLKRKRPDHYQMLFEAGVLQGEEY
jgi:thiamine-triphosphatase